MTSEEPRTQERCECGHIESSHLEDMPVIGAVVKWCSECYVRQEDCEEFVPAAPAPAEDAPEEPLWCEQCGYTETQHPGSSHPFKAAPSEPAPEEPTMDLGHDEEITAAFAAYDKLVRWEEQTGRLDATDPVHERAMQRGRIVALISNLAVSSVEERDIPLAADRYERMPMPKSSLHSIWKSLDGRKEVWLPRAIEAAIQEEARPTPSQPVREAGDAEALGASWRELYTAHRRHLRDPRARDFGDGVLPYQWAVEAAIRAPLEAEVGKWHLAYLDCKAEVARLREGMAEIREHLDYGGDVGHAAALHVVECALSDASQGGKE